MTWLKPGGWVYCDVPSGETYQVCGTSHRQYDAHALQTRLVRPGLRRVRSSPVDDRGFYAPGERRNSFPYVALLMERV